MSPPADGKLPRESGTARVAGSAVAGITELAIFHPVVSTLVYDVSVKGKKLTMGIMNSTTGHYR
jgi:hypothetical protein